MILPELDPFSALHAALELGTGSFWEVIETLLTGTEQACEANLQRLFPAVTDQEIQRWGRSIRRALGAALLDKRMSADELRGEIRILIDGYVRHVQVQA
jgi:hypothetical protein